MTYEHWLPLDEKLRAWLNRMDLAPTRAVAWLSPPNQRLTRDSNR